MLFPPHFPLLLPPLPTQDVILQAEAQRWADRYNSLSPPKEVAFVPAFVIRLVDRPDKPYYACEALLKVRSVG